jgi:steroid 5-alpha reductase family enzyme
MSMVTALAANFGIIILLMLMLWGLACVIRDVSFIDAVWAYGMVVLAWTAALMAWPPAGLSLVAWLLVGLVSLWGVRLGTHLLLRWQDMGPDPRYEKIIGRTMERRNWGFPLTALVMVFLLQGPLLWWVCLPAQVGILSAGPADHPNIIGWIGVALAVAGIVFETIGDAQLAAFRREPASAGQVMNRGLWRYTRHPNYFGDACCWWGIYILAASSGGLALWTILSPVFLTFTLMRWSGAPLLEGRLKKTRPGYADYVARTSGFFPWPPRAN